MEQVEQKLMDILVTPEHLFLLIGIFSVLLLLRWIKPIRNFLFADKWKWLIAPINILLSALGVFLLGLTTVSSAGMKVIVALAASALVTLTYEAVAKYIINWVEEWFKKKLGKE